MAARPTTPAEAAAVTRRVAVVMLRCCCAGLVCWRSGAFVDAALRFDPQLEIGDHLVIDLRVVGHGLPATTAELAIETITH